MRKTTFFGILFALGAAAGAPPAEARDAPGVSVSYFIPTEGATGDVQVMSFGLAKLPVDASAGARRFLHVRLAAQNHADPTAWTLDAREQLLLLPDGRRLAPRFAEASTGGERPYLVLPKGERAYLDLFFPMPDRRDPAATSLAWVVRRGNLVTVASTAFQRLSDGGSEYEYYGPAHHHGGTMLVGSFWCSPHDWHSPWMHRYAPYGHYRHRVRDREIEVSRDGDVWRGEPRVTPPRPHESVGVRWRREAVTRSASSEETRRAVSVDAPRSGAHEPSVGRSWRDSAPVRGTSSSSSAQTARPSSEGSGSGSSESSSSGDNNPPLPSSSGSSDSVGSRWRSGR